MYSESRSTEGSAGLIPHSKKSLFSSPYDATNQRTNGPVNAHLSLLHVPKNMFEYYGI